jgi:hypothetical protein
MTNILNKLMLSYGVKIKNQLCKDAIIEERTNDF